MEGKDWGQRVVRRGVGFFSMSGLGVYIGIDLWCGSSLFLWLTGCCGINIVFCCDTYQFSAQANSFLSTIRKAQQSSSGVVLVLERQQQASKRWDQR